MSNVKLRRGSKSTTNSLGSNSQTSDSTLPTAKRSAKPATTKNPPPWLKKDGATVVEGAAASKETQDVRKLDERKARETAEEGQEKRRQEVLRRRVDDLKKGGATHSKAYGR